MNNQVKKIKKFLSSCNDVILAFLFGSFAKGNVTSSSDVDIAILFNQHPDFYAISNMSQKLSKMLINKHVDIVPLNNASPIIKMQVLKNGIILVNKDSKSYNEFFVSTIIEYDDLKQLRKEIEENILRGKIYA